MVAVVEEGWGSRGGSGPLGVSDGVRFIVEAGGEGVNTLMGCNFSEVGVGCRWCGKGGGDRGDAAGSGGDELGNSADDGVVRGFFELFGGGVCLDSIDAGEQGFTVNVEGDRGGQGNGGECQEGCVCLGSVYGLLSRDAGGELVMEAP